LNDILTRVSEFKTNGLQWFYEYLEEEPDDALDSNSIKVLTSK